MTRTEAAKIARAAKAKNAPPLHERFWSKVDIRGEMEACEMMAA